MRAKPRFVRLLVIALIVSLALGACGGGTSGSTWFNLPSVKLEMRDNGTASLYGFSLNRVILQPAMIQSLQGAGIQRLEARIGYNGIHVYTNGEDLPYVSWDATSTENLQEVLAALPPSVLPNGAMIARYLPWLRKIGLGVRFELPPGTGDFPRWTGETSVTPEQPTETTIGPITIASLVFDPNGEAIIEGIPVSQIEQMTGSAIPLQLDANTMALLSSIGAESVKIETQPNGINVYMNDEPLPGVAYDTARLNELMPLVNAFVADPATQELIAQVLPLLPGAEVTVLVSFTGEPSGDTDIGTITVVANEDGTLSLGSGIPLPGAALPPEVVSQLQEANVQQLDVNLLDDRLGIAANGQALPTISIADESMDTLAALVAPIAGIQPELITEGLAVVKGLNADMSLRLPPAAGAEPVEIPDGIDFTMQPADIGDVNVPTIQFSAKYGPDGFTEVGGISAQTLALLGVSLPTLPPDLVNTLREQGVSTLEIVAGTGAINVLADSETALTVNYDNDSLQTTMDLATPFLGEESPIARPALAQFLREQVLPILPAANVNMKLTLE